MALRAAAATVGLWTVLTVDREQALPNQCCKVSKRVLVAGRMRDDGDDEDGGSFNLNFMHCMHKFMARDTPSIADNDKGNMTGTCPLPAHLSAPPPPTTHRGTLKCPALPAMLLVLHVRPGPGSFLSCSLPTWLPSFTSCVCVCASVYVCVCALRAALVFPAFLLPAAN